MHATTSRLLAAIYAVKGLPGEPAATQAAADALGVSLQRLTNWLERGVSRDGILLASRLLHINQAWVESGIGEMVTKAVSSEQQASYTPSSLHTTAAIAFDNNPDYPAVRRVRFKLSAGASGFGVEYLQDEGAPIVFQREWFMSRGYKPEQLFAVKVSNGSMEPGLFDGDTVVVNTAQSTPRDGVVFAVNYEGELVIKRLVRDGGQWWLCSDNPDQRRYPRKAADEHCHILGEIVHKQSERI